MKKPRIIGTPKEIKAIERAFDYLAMDKLLSARTSKPWALQFVCDHIHVIECKNLGESFGRSLGNGRVLIDCKLNDEDWKYWDIAAALVHEANHEYWWKKHGTRSNSPKEEDDCRKEQADFLDRIKKRSDYVREKIGTYAA